MFLHSDSHSSLESTKVRGIRKECGRRQGGSQPFSLDRKGCPESFPRCLCSQILRKGWILTCTGRWMKFMAALEEMGGKGGSSLKVPCSWDSRVWINWPQSQNSPFPPAPSLLALFMSK